MARFRPCTARPVASRAITRLAVTTRRRAADASSQASNSNLPRYAVRKDFMKDSEAKRFVPDTPGASGQANVSFDHERRGSSSPSAVRDSGPSNSRFDDDRWRPSAAGRAGTHGSSTACDHLSSRPISGDGSTRNRRSPRSVDRRGTAPNRCSPSGRRPEWLAQSPGRLVLPSYAQRCFRLRQAAFLHGPSRIRTCDLEIKSPPRTFPGTREKSCKRESFPRASLSGTVEHFRRTHRERLEQVMSNVHGPFATPIRDGSLRTTNHGSRG